MLIYNTKCPTVNNSFQLFLYNKINNLNIDYPAISFYDHSDKYNLEKIEERKLNQYIYYTLNSDVSYDFLSNFTIESLNDFIEEQQVYIKEQLKTLKEFNHISPSAYNLTEKQYNNLIFINGLAFSKEYVQEIIDEKQKIISDDIITDLSNSPLHIPVQQQSLVEINTEEIRRLAKFSTNVLINNQNYHLSWQDDIIKDSARFIYVLGSRQIGKSKSIGYLAFENSFIPNQKILVSSFSSLSASNMRDYILEYASNFPKLSNGQEAFTFHSKEAFLINNISKSKIFFRTLAEEGKGIRGMTLNLVIIDESAFVANEIYERVLLPTTTTTKGRIIALSTPERKNWFYDKVMDALKQRELGNSNVSLYEIDYTKNPFIYADPDLLSYIEENKHKASIKQEYMCQFIGEDDEIFSINLSSFYPDLKNSGHYVLSYDPARKGKDMAAFALSYTFNGLSTLILSGYIPKKEKQEWKSQADFLRPIQQKFNAKFIMDITGVGDGVIAIMKQYGMKVDMAINYTNSNKENIDKSHPYGSTQTWNVGKGVLINKAIDFCDEQILEIYEYTNKQLLKEISLLQKKVNKLGQILFETEFFDDAVNAMLLNVYYIFQKNLISKKYNPEIEYDPYDIRTHIGNYKEPSRTF